MSHLQKKLVETISEKAQTSHFLDKNFKSPILNMLKKLKEIRIIMYKQIENINKEKKILKSTHTNSEA